MKKQDQGVAQEKRRQIPGRLVYVEPRRLLSLEQLAERLGIAPQTIKNEMCKGTFRLRPKKQGKRVFWDSWDVDEYIGGLPYAPGPCSVYPEYSDKENTIG